MNNVSPESLALLLPFFSQVLLTFLIWGWMVVTRLQAVRKSGTKIQKLLDESHAAQVYGSSIHAADNFENLLEMPVLFYIAILFLLMTGTHDALYVQLAWTFVVLRAVHSLIHCTINHVRLRFIAFFFSSLALLVMWVKIAMDLL